MSLVKPPRGRSGHVKKPGKKDTLFEGAVREGHRETPLTIQDVLSERWHRPGNRFMRTLEMLPVGQQALAGIARETIGPRSMDNVYHAALRGIRDSASFTETIQEHVPGRKTAKALGFAADLVVDPINFVPIAKPLSYVGKGAGVAGKAGVRALRTTEVGADIADKAAVHGDRIARSVYRRFNPNKLLQRGGFNRVLILKERMQGQRNILRSQLLDTAERKIVELVKDPKRRGAITRVLDAEPVEGMLPDGTILKPELWRRKEWIREYNKLNPEEKRAALIARDALKKLEKMKISEGMLDPKRAAGIIMAEGGRAYVPRRLVGRGEVLRVLRDKAAALRGEAAEVSIENIPKAQREAALTATNEMIELFDRMPNAINLSYADRIDAMYSGKMTSWDNIRKMRGQIKDFDSLIQETIEHDIAKILNVERREVGRSLAVQNFFKDTLKYMYREGLALPAKSDIVAATPGKWKKLDAKVVEWKTKGPQAEKVIHNLDDVVFPAEVADEINAALKSYMDPKSIREAQSTIRNMTKFYKAWTLSPFPGYHVRNMASNVWQNTLAGMRLKDQLVHGEGARVMQRKIETGSFTNEPMLKHYTDHQMSEMILRHRVTRGGPTEEFADAVTKIPTTPGGILKRTITPNPSENIAVQAGFKVGTHIEDNARISHFMWRLSKGDTPERAARSVRKFLFDYEHGLSDFEKNVFRDRLFPFYAWTRFNLPLQLEMFARHTGRFAAAEKGINAWEDTMGGPAPNQLAFQQWLQNAGKVRAFHDKKTGDYRYFFLGGFWPGSEIEKAMSGERVAWEIANMTTPYLRVPMELLSNFNLFQRRKIQRMPDETARVRLGVPGLSPAVEAFAPGKLSVQATLPVKLEHALRSVRIINETDKLLGEFNQELGGGLRSGITRTLFGKTYPVNVEKQRKKWAYEINFRIAELSAVRSWGEITKNEGNIAKAEAEIEKLKALKQELGISGAHE